MKINNHRIPVTLDDPLWEYLHWAGENENRPMSDIVREAIRDRMKWDRQYMLKNSK